MKFIDSHSHFNLSQFDSDREEAIKRMRDNETGTFCVGIDLETSKLAVELANKNKDIWATVGQHPTEWNKEFNVDSFREIALADRVVAIGECGLDYFREKERENKEKQKEIFKKQIELAIELNLPLMLHIRPEQKVMPARLIGGDAYEDALAIIKEYKKSFSSLIGAAHFFAGNIEIAKQFLDLGFYLSFDGPITFTQDYDEVIKFVPIDRILSETDSPFAAPVPFRGKRCEPQYVQEVVKRIAEIKGLPPEGTRKHILNNTERLFYKSAPLG